MNNYNEIRENVLKANLALVDAGLVILTWGNASAADREKGIMAIKPSGVSYSTLKSEDIVIQSIETGEVLSGSLRPSSDSPTHLELYRAFPEVGGIVHTHSSFAVSWAQAEMEIPCYGTTHADHFYGSVPLTRQLTAEEIEEAYEANTGKVIAERFRREKLNPLHFPGVLLPHHGPFTWGTDCYGAVKNAIALEEIAKMAFYTETLNPSARETSPSQLNKHFSRKHGPKAYYGQN